MTFVAFNEQTLNNHSIYDITNITTVYMTLPTQPVHQYHMRPLESLQYLYLVWSSPSLAAGPCAV